MSLDILVDNSFKYLIESSIHELLAAKEWALICEKSALVVRL